MILTKLNNSNHVENSCILFKFPPLHIRTKLKPTPSSVEIPLLDTELTQFRYPLFLLALARKDLHYNSGTPYEGTLINRAVVQVSRLSSSLPPIEASNGFPFMWFESILNEKGREVCENLSATLLVLFVLEGIVSFRIIFFFLIKYYRYIFLFIL